jgi:hypothetical protein
VDDYEYSIRKKVVIWVVVFVGSWALAIAAGYAVYKFLFWYFPLIVCVWELYIQWLQKLYNGNAE